MFLFVSLIKHAGIFKSVLIYSHENQKRTAPFLAKQKEK